ncbi:hypothetical protein [Paenibacillus sinopodophylli]|uniref:hypothetical protein n=1 Tax=Paenibacillus sinopodophylli TaxID=1837342 RepID=UPI00110D1AC5|nr:hypothetical protein [Paenibacillus sinopodophylli]
MEQQKTGKRSLALPITLVILVFSLIGNVFLYSQFLQHKQENNHAIGQRIFKAAVSSQQYASEMIPLLDGLLQSKSVEERLALAFSAGKLSAKGSGLAELTAEAAGIAGAGEEWNTEIPASYVSNVEKGLLDIGQYEGALNASDAAYLTELKGSFEALSGIIGQFNAAVGETRIAIIRLASGLDWMELVSQAQKVMTEQAAKPAA